MHAKRRESLTASTTVAGKRQEKFFCFFSLIFPYLRVIVSIIISLAAVLKHIFQKCLIPI